MGCYVYKLFTTLRGVMPEIKGEKDKHWLTRNWLRINYLGSNVHLPPFLLGHWKEKKREFEKINEMWLAI